jgi:hypothetical protein
MKVIGYLCKKTEIVMIKYFNELTDEQKNAIYSDCMIANFDKSLSFALVKEGEVTGYVLLRKNIIPQNIKIQPPIQFDSSENACEIIRVKSYVQPDLEILLSLLKHTSNRIEMWADKEEGPFNYFWGMLNKEEDANFYANCLDCEISKCLIGSDTVHHLIYRKLLNDFTD